MMKKNITPAVMCLTLSMLMLGGAKVTVASASPSTAIPAGDDKYDLKAGEGDNQATFSWSGTTLTVTGKGDLSKVTVTDPDTKLFSAKGAGQVYTKSTVTTTTKDNDGKETTTTTEVYNAAKKGQVYYNTTSYYQPTITYGDAITPSTTDYTYGNGSKYKMTKSIEDKLTAGQTLYNIYFSAQWDQTKNKNVTSGVVCTSATKPADQLNSIWNTNDDGYYYYAVVTGTIKLNESYSLDKLTGDGYTITILTKDNINNYCPLSYPITSCVENLYYSTDEGATKNYLAKDATVTYADGMKLYLGTNTGVYTLVADNEEFFKTNASWLETGTLSFADYLAPAVNYLGSKDATVIFKTDTEGAIITDNSKKANINNEITRALVKIDAITTLNLQDTYLEEIINPDESKQTNPTFYLGENPGAWDKTTVRSNTTLKTLYMPAVKDGSTLKGSGTDGETNRLTCIHYLAGLENLYIGEGVETLAENALYETGTKYDLKTISFPNSLKKAGKNCMSGQSKVETLTFPAGMEEIEHAAFWGTNPKDVYFLGKEAPKVSAFAWGESNYISNNAMENKVEDGQEGYTVTVDRETGYACRTNYNTRNGWYAMLHYPAACSKEQAAKYTDLTRKYTKIVYGDSRFPKVESGDGNEQGTMYYYYEPGKETETLKGKDKEAGDAGITGNIEASKKFINIYPAGTYGGNYDGGYDDMYVGTQYQWPSMGMSQRAIIVAENNLLWDGVTSIGEGIKNAATSEGKTSSYTGDGSEYIGLHQFVFAQGDVTTDKTDEWDVTKYADGKWHSLCVPFNITKAKLEETFGKNAEGKYDFRVCMFNKVDRTDDNLKLYFDNEQYTDETKATDVVIAAHVSYMVKLKKEGIAQGDKVVLKDYVLVSGSALPTNVTANAKSSEGSEGTETNANQYYFIGQYQSGITIPQYSYFFSKTTSGFRFQTGTNGKWNAYSSVVEAPNGEEDYNTYFKTGSQAKLITVWDNNETTGVEKVTVIAGDEIVATNANVYNLSGQLVSTNGRNGLAKGLYIQNGKKFVVK